MNGIVKIILFNLATVLVLLLASEIHIQIGSNLSENGDEIPSNLSEAVKFLDQEFDKDAKEKLVYYSKTPHQNLTAYEMLEESSYGHHGLGMSIRNSWGLWTDSRLKRWFLWRGVTVPDTISKSITDEFLVHLEGGKIRNYILRRILVLVVLSLFFNVCLFGILRITKPRFRSKTLDLES